MPPDDLSHFDESGRARMVDITGKTATSRRARAEGTIHLTPSTVNAITDGRFPKGNPFEVARLAGIAAAKKTAELIPLCHPLRLNTIDVEIVQRDADNEISVIATVSADERTGVEMEALVACSIALLTVYDMLKAIDHGMVLSGIRLLEKTGGKSDYNAPISP